MSTHFLSVVCMFRNEEDILVEWMEHYLLHGVEHFYMINDNSDDSSCDLIQPYVERGLVTLMVSNWGRYIGRQRDILTTYMMPHIKETQWLLYVDMDEFVWSQVSRDLKDVFRMFSNLAQIQFNHTLFGSNGLVEQPDSIVQAFTKRTHDRPSSFTENLKYAVNTKYEFTRFNVHHAEPLDGVHNSYEFFQRYTEPYFIMNHYNCQSYNHWCKVKCTRGDGDHYLIRTSNEFALYDVNDVEDSELASQNNIA